MPRVLSLAVRRHESATRASTHGSAQDVQSAPVRSLPTRAVKIIKPRPSLLCPTAACTNVEKKYTFYGIGAPPDTDEYEMTTERFATPRRQSARGDEWTGARLLPAEGGSESASCEPRQREEASDGVCCTAPAHHGTHASETDGCTHASETDGCVPAPDAGAKRSQELSVTPIRRRARGAAHAGAVAVALLACCQALVLAQRDYLPNRDVIRLGGEWVNISKALPLSSHETTMHGWRGGAADSGLGQDESSVLGSAGLMLRQLWAAARRRLGGSEDEEEPAQWYLGLTSEASIDRLEAASDVSIGLPANVGVHVMTGTASAVRRLAADSQVLYTI